MQQRGLFGVQATTIIGQIHQMGLRDALVKCVDAGYHSIELSGVALSAENKKAVRDVNEQYGMKVAATSVVLDRGNWSGTPMSYLGDEEGFRRTVEDCRELDCKFLRVGAVPMHCWGQAQQTLDYVKRLNDYALRLQEEGLKLFYHIHHIDVIDYNGRCLLDVMHEEAPAVNFELDTHWLYFGGKNPLDYIRKFSGNIELLHLKDYRMGAFHCPEYTEGMSDAEFDRLFMDACNGMRNFAAIGDGTLPMKDYIDAGLAGGSQYFLIEQDDCYGEDPFVCLKRSHDNLVAMGYGEWFPL